LKKPSPNPNFQPKSRQRGGDNHYIAIWLQRAEEGKVRARPAEKWEPLWTLKCQNV